MRSSRSFQNRAMQLVAFVTATLTTAATPTRVDAQFFGPMPVIDATAIARLATQLSVARNQLATLQRNMTKLGAYNVRDVRATLAQIDAVSRRGLAISYSLSNLDRVVTATFPGGQLSSTMAADMRTQDARTVETIRAALSASRVTAAEFATETAQLAAMQAQLRGIRSAQQAAELSGLVGVHTVGELTLLRQQLAAQGNASTVYLAYQANRAAQANAAAAAFDSAGMRRPPVRPRVDVTGLGFVP